MRGEERREANLLLDFKRRRLSILLAFTVTALSLSLYTAPHSNSIPSTAHPRASRSLI